MAAYTEELVYVHSEDGYVLEGAVIRPAGRVTQGRPIIWVHGLTGKFYAHQIVGIGRGLAERGHVFVTGNNRGRDFGAILRTADLRRLIAGGAWEIFGESPRDVAAWIDLAARIGDGEVILLGHSLGSLKVCYYQAQRRDPRVRALIAASPPLHAGTWSDATRDQAARMEAEGRGRDLLPWDFMDAGAGTLSAQTVLGWVRANIDVYGGRTSDPAVARVDCPILAFYGTEEGPIGSAADLETVRRNAKSSPRVDTAMIEGSDHNYNGHEGEVAALIARWVESL
jgi:pimeloyl-ACP methyl ester carboxylesterase